MHRPSWFSLLALALVLNGCAPNAQLIRLAAPTLKTTPAGLVLDNDTLTLTFDFYRERGGMQLTMVNKLAVPLYVDWKQSALILGQDKLDYWYDVSDVNLTGGGYSGRYSRYYTLGLSGTISREDRVAFLPPRTRLIKQQFILVPETNGLPLVGSFAVVMVAPKIKGEGGPISVQEYTFNPANSPLRFRNYLTVSTDKDFRTRFAYDTEFYADQIQLMSRNQLESGRVNAGMSNQFYVIQPLEPDIEPVTNQPNRSN